MEKLGIIFLMLGTCFAVWSALMPSVFTIYHFGIKEGEPDDKAALLTAGIVAVVIIVAVVWATWTMYFRGGGNA